VVARTVGSTARATVDIAAGCAFSLCCLGS
jgi:hypothetical protein